MQTHRPGCRRMQVCETRGRATARPRRFSDLSLTLDDQLAGQRLSVATVQGSNVHVDGTDGVTVDGANVTAADIIATNGVIHVIDEVILPHNTRRRICRALNMLRNKTVENPWKKHDNIPL